MFESLNEFSKKVARQILHEFPDWREFYSLEGESGSKYFLLQINPPTGSSEFPLSIDTSNDEVTVAYDHYHAHYFDFISQDGNDAFSFIKKLLSDDTAIASYWRDDIWCASYMVSVGCLPSNNDEQPYANLIKIRSWSGLSNKDIKCVPRG